MQRPARVKALINLVLLPLQGAFVMSVDILFALFFRV